jgi:hypothetical protein
MLRLSPSHPSLQFCCVSQLCEADIDIQRVILYAEVTIQTIVLWVASQVFMTRTEQNAISLREVILTGGLRKESYIY